MNVQRIEFSMPWEVNLKNITNGNVDGPQLQNEYSVISAGTELAILSGNESWAPLPFTPGYGSVGIALNNEGTLSQGKRYFTYGKHQSVVSPETLCLELSAAIQPKHAAFARMAAVSITAIRCSSIALGDTVCVVGGGLVGNFAAQLARLSGASSVTLVEPFKKRRAIAEQCGISRTYNSIEAVGEVHFDTVIEATGNPKVAVSATSLVGDKGEFILLGSPRGSHKEDVVPLLNRSHLCPTNMTIKGAHEWRYPLHVDPEKRYRFSIEGNIQYLLQAIAEGTLAVDPMITHIITPKDAPKVYKGLREHPEEYLGVLIDWRKEA